MSFRISVNLVLTYICEAVKLQAGLLLSELGGEICSKQWS